MLVEYAKLTRLPSPRKKKYKQRVGKVPEEGRKQAWAIIKPKMEKGWTEEKQKASFEPFVLRVSAAGAATLFDCFPSQGFFLSRRTDRQLGTILLKQGITDKSI
ncbi:hypothetical protein NPIL_80581 [Nephila pilipes]|uniref:Uncharacterized protein n=1 Tax=Nephila pilipes TaxID=299642 RepID=A0A8X6R6Q6_NEPPI|nr:hypothetical protein NPIL_80581 [Nephila pilipes]